MLYLSFKEPKLVAKSRSIKEYNYMFKSLLTKKLCKPELEPETSLTQSSKK